MVIIIFMGFDVYIAMLTVIIAIHKGRRNLGKKPTWKQKILPVDGKYIRFDQMIVSPFFTWFSKKTFRQYVALGLSLLPESVYVCCDASTPTLIFWGGSFSTINSRNLSQTCHFAGLGKMKWNWCRWLLMPSFQISFHVCYYQIQLKAFDVCIPNFPVTSIIADFRFWIRLQGIRVQRVVGWDWCLMNDHRATNIL